MLENLLSLWETTGIYKMIYTVGDNLAAFNPDFYKTLIMYVIVGVLMYLAIGKGYDCVVILERYLAYSIVYFAALYNNRLFLVGHR